MNKELIKVVRKAKKVEYRGTQAVVNPQKIERTNQIKMVEIVGSWISERRENQRIEKVFSESSITAWNSNHKTSKKTVR